MIWTLFSIAAAAPLAITNATIFPVSGPPIESGTVVFNDGRITAVGADVAVPEGAEVFDAGGKYLMPGLIDVHSHMGVYPWPGAEAHGDGNEATAPFTPRVWAGDYIAPCTITRNTVRPIWERVERCGREACT